MQATPIMELLDTNPKSTPGNPPSAKSFEPGDDASKRIVCAACGYAITHADARIERGGAHVHTRLNAAGVTFVFGTFREALGAQVSGFPSSEYTWFYGYAWRMANCGGCHVHLGWHFEGEVSFWALIFDRLSGG